MDGGRTPLRTEVRTHASVDVGRTRTKRRQRFIEVIEQVMEPLAGRLVDLSRGIEPLQRFDRQLVATALVERLPKEEGQLLGIVKLRGAPD